MKRAGILVIVTSNGRDQRSVAPVYPAGPVPDTLSARAVFIGMRGVRTTPRNPGMSGKPASGRASSADHARGLARALGGALLFGFPLMMTMEMWWLGFYLDRPRLLLLLLVTIATLVPLSYFVGFERTGTLLEDAIDALVAFAIGAIASAAMLMIFGVIGADMSADEIVGKIAMQTVPASIGAVLARGQFGGQTSDSREKQDRAGFGGQLFIAGAGAIFLSLNVAPTEEVVLLAYKLTP